MAGKKGQKSGTNPASWNNKAKKCKPWEEALGRLLEIHRPADQRKKLDALAKVVYDLAMDGDMGAITEIGNRLDGKAKQSVEVVDEGDSLLLKTVIGVTMDKNEAAQIYRNMMKTIPSSPETLVIDQQGNPV